MNKFLSSVLCAVLLSYTTFAAPASSSSLSANSTAPSATLSSSSEVASPTVPYASDNPNTIEWSTTVEDIDPQAIRGTLGGTILGPQNIPLDIQNPDLLAPPTTDAGTVCVLISLQALFIH